MRGTPISHEFEAEQAFLVLVNVDASEDDVCEAELEGLVEAAQGEVVGSLRQRVDRPYKATFIGKGKVEELKAAAAEAGADVVIFDTELSGVQIKNLEEETGLRVIDRTALVLDIFARRAKTREGQLQVEFAQLSYRLPRLMSVYTKFERQRGGIGMRGPGEMKLEADRRMVRDRLAALRQEIEGVKQHRAVQRRNRRQQPHPHVSLVGYTSAGKSTLMNLLSGTDLLADAMPFATLDPTTRKVDLPDGYQIFLTDTVGFIRNLPTFLVAAFRATLEEVTEADLLLHIVDVGDDAWYLRRDAVLETLDALGAAEIPIVTVFNKIDLLDDPTEARRLVAEWPNSVAVSSTTGEGVPDLVATIGRMLKERFGFVRLLIPHERADLVQLCYALGTVRGVSYAEEGVWMEAELTAQARARLSAYEK